MIETLGRFHPIVVHFPIAFIFGAVTAELLYIIRRKQYFGDTAHFMINAGALTAVVAVAFGFAAATNGYPSDAPAQVLSIHRILGIVIAGLMFAAAGLAESTRRSGQIWEQWVYRILLLAAAVLTWITSYNGGVLVFGRIH